MAWCPHCNADRPIQRQTYEGKCPICSLGMVIGNTRFEHGILCRGATIGTLDVCTFCNSPIFAKAKSQEEYIELENNETLMCQKIAEAKPCFVVTATMGEDAHPVVEEMRRFRSEILSRYNVGRAFINFYYQIGPKIAKRIEKSYILRLLSFSFVVLPAYLFSKTIRWVYPKVNR